MGGDNKPQNRHIDSKYRRSVQTVRRIGEVRGQSIIDALAQE